MWVEPDDTNFSAKTGDTVAVKEIFTAKKKSIGPVKFDKQTSNNSIDTLILNESTTLTVS